MKPKYYLIDVFGCVEPTAVGPFDTDEERDAQAKIIHAGQSEEDALFWANVDKEGNLVVGAFCNNDFREEEEEAYETL